MRAGSETPAAAAFLAEVDSAFERAVRVAGGTTDRYFALAGHILRLRFAGEALVVPMTRALAHLAVAPAAADLTVCLWDVASTGAPRPRPPWDRAAYGARSEILGYSDDHVHTAYQGDTRSLVMFDARRERAFYATADARALPSYESAAPLRTVLHWWSRRRDLQMVHGAVVGRADGCVLLAGEGGIGKSSTALACLQSDLLYLGDDYCLLDLREPQRPLVHSVYAIGKVTGATLERLPFLAPFVVNAGELETEKGIVFVGEAFPRQVVRTLPLRAIVVPRVTGRTETTVESASPSEVLARMAGSTHVQLPNAGEELLRRLGRVVRQTRNVHLLVGTDVAGIGAALLGILERGGSGAVA